MASRRDDGPGRLATLALAVSYLLWFWSWLPIPRELVGRLARSRYRRPATVLVVLAIAVAFVFDAL